ncbi:MAG: hypothetical protein H6719_16735 [Sandaracinaceae bacterium]|nr:hypothetical protein [Sandaracinaceae bacterium]
MKRFLVTLLLLGAAAPAHADLVVEMPHVRRPSHSVALSSVRRGSTDAPTADAERVLSEARSQLYGQRSRINRCLSGLDLREDPLRSRRRALTGRLVFSRSGRPAVHIDSTRGIPGPARACIEEGVRAVAVRTAPRGSVEIRFTFTLQ